MSTYIKDTSDIEADRQQRLIKYQKMIENKQNISSHERLMKSLHLSYGHDKNSLTLDLDAYRNEISEELNDKLVDFLNQTDKKITTVFCNDVYKTPCRLFYQMHGDKKDKLIVEDNDRVVRMFDGNMSKEIILKPFTKPIDALFISSNFFYQTKKQISIKPQDCRKIFHVRDIMVEILPLFSKCSCLRFCDTVEVGWNFHVYRKDGSDISDVDLTKYKLDILTSPITNIVLKNFAGKNNIIVRDHELENLINK